jgi:hypothetical protein
MPWVEGFSRHPTASALRLVLDCDRSGEPLASESRVLLDEPAGVDPNRVAVDDLPRAGP